MKTWYTPREVAEILGVSQSKVRLQIELKLLEAEVISRPVLKKHKRSYRAIRIYPEQLAAYCAKFFPRVSIDRSPAA
jgi:hypothetical protein